MNGKVSPCLKAYVINLAKSKDRWKYVSDQFSDSATWIEIQRLPAVYGPNLTKRQMDALIDPFVIDLLQKPEEIKMNPEVPPPGAIGCYLSHVKAWKAVLGATFERDAIAKEASRIGSVDFRSLPETTLNDRTSGHGNSINKQLLNRVLSIQDDADTDRDNHLKMANDSKQQQQQHDTQQLLHRNTTQNMALIMEDDIKILCKRKELASKLYECLKYAPSDWEMLIVEKVVHLLPPIQIKDNKRFRNTKIPHLCSRIYTERIRCKETTRWLHTDPVSGR